MTRIEVTPPAGGGGGGVSLAQMNAAIALAVTNLVGGAGAARDTLGELSAAIDASSAAATAALAAKDLQGAQYSWSTSAVIADPGVGKIRYDGGTGRVAISDTDDEGVVRSGMYNEWGGGSAGFGAIYIRGASGLAAGATILIAGAGLGWKTITLSNTLQGPAFANNELVWVHVVMP